MFKIKDTFEYYYLNETCINEDIAKKHLKPISENSVTIGDKKYTTLTYEQALQSFGNKNWNGRSYVAMDTLKALDTNPLIQYDISKKSWTSEYGHPILEKGMNELQRQMTILPERACNTINKYWLDGNILLGECTTLYGSWGEVLMGRIITGYPAMASSRAIGGVDSRGNVLPGYTIITYDTVIRPSHKEAYMVNNSEKLNDFSVPSGNTMNESVMKIDIQKDDAFKNFIMNESMGSDRVNLVLDTFGLDYNSMSINGNNIEIKRMNENSTEKVFIPIKKIIATEYHNLF